MNEECEYCSRRKFCTKEEPEENECCEDCEPDEKLFE